MRFHKNVFLRLGGPLWSNLVSASLDLLDNWGEVSCLTFASAVLVYMLGSRTGMRYRHQFYRYLKKAFSHGDGIFDFPGLFRLPVVPDRHGLIFALEFGDLVAPYLWPSRRALWPGDEGPYEAHSVAVRPGDVVVDVGANVGMFSAFAASKGADVYAFEPAPEPYSYLAKTVELNCGLAGDIRVVPLALMDTPQKVELTVSDLGGASAVLARDTGSKLLVEATTLDQWVALNDLPKVDFIKADIEGAERFLLRGASQVLKEHQPKLAICTYHLDDDAQVLEDLILSANPRYLIRHTPKKLFAWVQSEEPSDTRDIYKPIVTGALR